MSLKVALYPRIVSNCMVTAYINGAHLSISHLLSAVQLPEHSTTPPNDRVVRQMPQTHGWGGG